jgi:hypothetical protein
MPKTKYIKISIEDQQVDLEAIADAGIPISYKLEDKEDFQKKKSAESFGVKIPATLANDAISNTFHNPAVEDQSADEAFKRPRNATVDACGYELLIGKAFLKRGRHSNKPLGYEYDFYGGNADWMIDLKEATLFDFLKHVSFQFTRQAIVNSWQFDGRDETLPYVFAPVRYGQAMGDKDVDGVYDDRNMKAEYMKPSISKYWLIYWAFQSLGYRVQSSFFDTDYFRRQVMLWTWGNFLFSEGTSLTDLDFLAKGSDYWQVWNSTYDGFVDVKADNHTTNGGFDNNGVYSYDVANMEMKWTYLPAFNYSTLEGTFHFQASVDAIATAASIVQMRLLWYKNGVLINGPAGSVLVNLLAPSVGRRDYNGMVDDYVTVTVNPGDVISAKVRVFTFDSLLGRAHIRSIVEGFELDYFRVPLGGTVNFNNYTGFKKYKFLDFLRGVVDEFDLLVGTDAISKVVYFEPAHDYSLTGDLSQTRPGYFNSDFLDWNEKQDISEDKESEIENYSDSERELLFKYKADQNDGILKKVQDRNSATVAQGKYVLPDRFKAGKKEIENRFFSPVMHYEVKQWKYITGNVPQMICMVPENISGTSRDEAQNTFNPKSAYYKGLQSNVGWVFHYKTLTQFPFMFAVNYGPGGENDPILSYSDERIGSGPSAVMGKGLLRRFYLPRMAIIRNGQYYSTHFRLNNLDVTNWLHREHIICRGQRWELVEINEYKPLVEESTACFLRKWAPVSQKDSENVFPSPPSIMDSASLINAFDIKYQTLKCLSSDIPK